MSLIHRSAYHGLITQFFDVFPVVAILGPRQCGKSTLAKSWVSTHPGPVHYFDLENDFDLSQFQEAQLTLQNLEGLIVIDEIQRRPNLFPLLRYLADNKKQQYLILGSASRDLINQSSETLAGRIGYVELPPFSTLEIPPSEQETLWLRGGFPRSFLAKSDQTSNLWRQQYITTFLERDIASHGIGVEPATLRRFWQMATHYHGQIFNASEIAGSLGMTSKTAQRYLDILQGTFMLRSLKPWFENIGKRQIKSPKVYFRDSGLFHTLLGVTTKDELLKNPKLGASWEGFALEEVIRRSGANPDDCYFWATSNQAELDLLILKDGQRLGFEFKYSLSPKVTKSMTIAREDLKLDELTVVTPQISEFPLNEFIWAKGIENIPCKFGI